MTERIRRVLVLANETLASGRARDAIARLAGPHAEVVLVVPALHRNRLEHWFSSGTERARAEAEARLEASVAALRGAGVPAEGALGDADPGQALDDAVRVHAPDAVVVCTHPPARSLWVERGLVTRARSRNAMPVTHVVVDVDADAVEVYEDPRAGRAVLPDRVRLFARLDYHEAMRVRESGFSHSLRMRGAAPVGGRGGITFAVDIPGDELPSTPAGDGELEVPPGLLNRYGPPMMVDEWSE